MINLKDRSNTTKAGIFIVTTTIVVILDILYIKFLKDLILTKEQLDSPSVTINIIELLPSVIVSAVIVSLIAYLYLDVFALDD